MRKPITTAVKLRSHIQKKHKGDDSREIMPHNGDVISQHMQLTNVGPELYFSTPQQTIYHRINRHKLGNHYLVGKSNFKTTLSQVYSRIANDEVRMQMEIADFVATLSRQQRKKFCNIVAAMEKKYREQSERHVCS